MSKTATVRALVVDDDQDDVYLMQDLLSDAHRARFVVDTAFTATEAKSKVQRHRYNVILLDYRMPDLTGLGFMAWLDENHFRVPVIIVTSHGDRQLQTEALDAGAADYLEKGTFQGDLLERTCLYAIGLNERQLRGGGEAAGVGMLIQELVGLTRESVTAQTKAASETTELRKGLSDLGGSIEKGFDRTQKQTKEQTESILKEIRRSTKEVIRDAFSWILEHPTSAIMLVLGFTLLITLAVLLLNVLDTEKVKDLRGNPPAIEESSSLPKPNNG